MTSLRNRAPIATKGRAATSTARQGATRSTEVLRWRVPLPCSVLTCLEGQGALITPARRAEAGRVIGMVNRLFTTAALTSGTMESIRDIVLALGGHALIVIASSVAVVFFGY